MKLKAIGLAALLAATGFGGVQVAMAQQEGAPAPMQEQPAQQLPAPDDTKLDSFVVAFLEVDRIGKEYAPRLQQAQGDEQSKMREEAGKAMVEAVEKQQGITVDEYNSIIEQAQTDPDLANRINSKLRETAQ